MMLEAVEGRFGSYRATYPVEMLSDNGSPYIARETRIFARQVGLKPCYTPVKSTQSNGISEAFVKTLKRDYVQVTPLPDATTEYFGRPLFLMFRDSSAKRWRSASSSAQWRRNRASGPGSQQNPTCSRQMRSIDKLIIKAKCT